jgi:[protein-PII] uridylyltransferase
MSHDNQELVTYGKTALAKLYADVETAYQQEKSGADLMQMMCSGVDEILVHLWQEVAPKTAQKIDFVAVGGYGRGELAPQSDWDVWFLVPHDVTDEVNEDIQRFLYVLWDMNAKIGHAVRNIKETILHIKEDWSSATAAQEMRLLCGKSIIFDELKQETSIFFKKKRKNFVTAKLTEHELRHQRTGNSAFLMEPDIKECKGGLRDVQSAFWIAKAWFEVENIEDLVSKGFISEREMFDLLAAQDFLWRCRTGLHLQTKRPNDRLSYVR